MEEDDPVVDEISVFISQALSDNLCLYQYPIQLIGQKNNKLKVCGVAIKPRNQIAKLEFALDTYSDGYCASKGEQIALNTDGPQEPKEEKSLKSKGKEKGPYFKSGMMDKIVYESSRPCTELDRYAVTILQDKELHFTPVKSILQFRPSYSYFDKQDKRKKEKGNADDSDDDEEELDQVSVKFKRFETELAKKAREKSFEAVSQRIAEERWYDAMWKKLNTDHSELERMKLFTLATERGTALNLSATEYMKVLFPHLNDETEMTPFKKPSLQDRIKDILKDAKVLTFNELLRLVGGAGGGKAGGGRVGVNRAGGSKAGGGRAGEADGSMARRATELLVALRSAACCVRGLWVPRSEDLFTQPSKVPARNMCAARDHVLYLLTHNRYVDRSKVAASVRLPTEDVMSILQSVAKFTKNRGWELLIPPDTVFEETYPDVMEKQNMYWEARQRQFTDMLIGEPTPRRQRKKSQRDSIGSDSMMSPKPRKKSVSEEDSERKRQKKSNTSKRTRHVSSSSGHET